MDDLAGLTAQLENALRQFFGIFFVAGERLVNNTKESFGRHLYPLKINPGHSAATKASRIDLVHL